MSVSLVVCTSVGATCTADTGNIGGNRHVGNLDGTLLMTLKQLIKQKEDAVQKLEDGILAKMDEVARQINLDEMWITGYGNTFKRNGKEIKSAKIEKLDKMYCDHVSAGGFEAYWCKEKGWG